MSRVSKITKESVLKCIDEGALSQTDILVKLGLKARGGNYGALVLKCKEWEIELPVYSMERRLVQLGSVNTSRRVPLSQLLVKGRKLAAHSAKKRIIKEELLENKCAICSLPPTWNSMSLVLQLDHIDGDHMNNEITNLRLICPNCHSQTDTFAGKNINGS